MSIATTGESPDTYIGQMYAFNGRQFRASDLPLGLTPDSDEVSTVEAYMTNNSKTAKSSKKSEQG